MGQAIPSQHNAVVLLSHFNQLRAISRRALCAVALAGAVLAVAAPGVGATLPGANGRITFMRMDSGDHWQVWVADAGLGGQVQITEEDANSGWSVWAPDGSRLAFDSDRTDADPSDDTPINDVFTMRPDGSDVRKLTDSASFSGDAAYAPDGRHIAFDSDRGDYPAAQGIYITDLTGEELRRVTATPGDGWMDLAPRFSPDGSRLVFTRVKNFEHRPRGRLAGETSALFIVNSDGTNPRRITDWGIHPGDADWSPDGNTITFETQGREHPGKGSDIYIVRPDGSGEVNVTRNDGVRGLGNENAFVFENSSDPVFSPDGTRILFLDGKIGGGAFSFGLATMAPDGTDRAYLTSDPMDEHQPDWEAVASP